MIDSAADQDLRYSVVVPVFHEAENIGAFCAAARAKLPPGYELLICYDLDEDNTLPALQALPADHKPANIRLVHNTLGRGVRYAIQCGMRAASAPVVVVTMVDLSDDLGQVDQMVALVESGADVVCASRYMRGGRQVGGPRLKRLLSRTAGVTLHHLAGVPTHDPTNSFKAYRKTFLDATEIESTAGFSLGMELTVKAHFGGGVVKELPTVWQDRAAGESRFRLLAWLPHYLRWYLWSLKRRWFDGSTNRAWQIMLAVILAFLIVRVPVMFREPGGQDEGYYAVPGWTVLREGIPRIPYLPSRDRDSVYYYADRALFALPPAYFYWQAGCHALVGPSYGAARLASTLAGLLALVVIYYLGWQLSEDRRAGLWAAGLYSLSRVFYFQATTARPDTLCCLLGLTAVACTWNWSRSQRTRWLVAAGALVGLGGLTHPFAVVYAAQIGIWVLLGSSTWSARLRNLAIWTIAVTCAFSAWLPLILSYPEIFRSQFFSNVLDRSGPGLLTRVVPSLDLLAHHSRLMLERAGPLQISMMVAAPLVLAVLAVRGARLAREHHLSTLLWLTLSGAYLLIVCQGFHPSKGYWCYPAAFLFLCVGYLVVMAHDLIRQLSQRKIWQWAGAALLIAAMLPGSGVRTFVAHLRHWHDVDYHSPRFVDAVLADIPPAAELMVDPAYVLDVYVSGRPTVLASTHGFYFDVRGTDYDYLIAGHYALQHEIPAKVSAVKVRAYGQPDELFACYAEVWTKK